MSIDIKKITLKTLIVFYMGIIYGKNNFRYGSSLKAGLFNKKRNKQTKNNQK